MQGYWDKFVVPHLIGFCCRQKAVMRDRAKIVPRARGDILELGCGGGANLGLYDWENVRQLAGIDPSPELLERAQAELARSGHMAGFLPGIAEALPFSDNSFDTILSTFTLCSVQDQAAAIAEARRVLRPGGRILFVEHGKSPDAGPAKWQHRIEPVWKRLAGGCHLTRRVGGAIADAGFTITDHHGHYMKRTPHWLGWVEYGEAVVRK